MKGDSTRRFPPGCQLASARARHARAEARRSDVAPLVWKSIAEGKSYRVIANEFNETGVVPARQRKWIASLTAGNFGSSPDVMATRSVGVVQIKVRQQVEEIGPLLLACGRRGLELKRTPVHVAADSMGIPILTPTTLRTAQAKSAFYHHAADVAVAAYGLLLPTPILEAPRSTLCRMEAGLDTGPIPMREVIPLRPEDTTGGPHKPSCHSRCQTRGEHLSIDGRRFIGVSGLVKLWPLLSA
jgi:hypothetical protein